MAEVTELLTPPEIPDIHSSDESEANITPEEKTDEGESKGHKQAKMNRNKRRVSRKNKARRKKQLWDKYKVELVVYKKKTKKIEAQNKKQDKI